VCCSMLQCVAESCRELQRVAVLTDTGPGAVCCSVLQRVYMHVMPLLTNTGTGLSVLQHVAVCCSKLQRDAVYMHEMPVLTNTQPSMNELQRVAACCELQRVAVYVRKINLFLQTLGLV